MKLKSINSLYGAVEFASVLDQLLKKDRSLQYQPTQVTGVDEQFYGFDDEIFMTENG